MMNSKSMVFVVAAILAVAAVGIVINYGLLDNDSEADKTKILIQDDEGVYFWIEGEGDNGFAALDDACEKFDVPLICSDSSFGKSIDSIFGIEMMQVELPSESNPYGVYAYWNQYSFIDGEWKANEVSIDSVKTAEVEAIAVVYSSTADVPLVTPSDAKVWNHSTNGTVFTIESSSGLFFKVNGTGDKVLDAFINATATYNIPFVPSSTGGIDSIFGIETAQVEPPSEANPYGVWNWWIQKVRTADGTGWESTTLMMSDINSSDTSEMKLIYGTETY